MNSLFPLTALCAALIPSAESGKDGPRLYAAAACGLVYQNPQPRQEDLASRYHDRYFAYEQENEENFFNLMRLGA